MPNFVYVPARRWRVRRKQFQHTFSAICGPRFPLWRFERKCPKPSTPNPRLAGGTVKVGAAGIILFLASFALLRWNEGQAVATDQARRDGEVAAVHVSETQVDEQNEGRFIHLTGTATTPDQLTDELFGVSINAIRLQRHVAMYQWQENATKKIRQELGGDSEFVTAFSYEKVWSDTVINSHGFQDSAAHQNPAEMKFQSRTRTTANVQLGGFQLNGELVAQLQASEPLSVSLDGVSADVRRNLRDYRGPDGTTGFRWTRWAMDDEPQIGDVRITFSYSPPSAEVTVMARQAGNALQPYTAKDGRQLCLLRAGHLPVDEITPAVKIGNDALVAILRAVAILMMFGGIAVALTLMSNLADVVPLCGELVRVGTGFLAALLTGAVSLLTVGPAWLLYSPSIGVLMFAAATGLAGVLFWQLHRQRTWNSQYLATAIPTNQLDTQEPEPVEETLGV